MFTLCACELAFISGGAEEVGDWSYRRQVSYIQLDIFKETSREFGDKTGCFQ